MGEQSTAAAKRETADEIAVESETAHRSQVALLGKQELLRGRLRVRNRGESLVAPRKGERDGQSVNRKNVREPPGSTRR